MYEGEKTEGKENIQRIQGDNGMMRERPVSFTNDGDCCEAAAINSHVP